MSRDHRQFLRSDLQLAVLSTPHAGLPLRSITAVHLLRILAAHLLGILLHCNWFKGSLQAVAQEAVWAREVRMPATRVQARPVRADVVLVQVPVARVQVQAARAQAQPVPVPVV
ncbi:hypothetical protein [Paraburkholderia sp. BR13444]|uniref:hypothetical protein n=1 Tax=Paraburkholderia sp. BR13444 TaxID=3236997 RepID=UPI0034CFFA50